MARPQSGCAGPLLSGSQYPEHRRAADAELTGNFRWTDTSSMELLHLVSLHPCCRRSAPVLPLGLGLGDADSMRSLISSRSNCAMMSQRWETLRASRSSLVTTSTSPSRMYSRALSSCSRSGSGDAIFFASACSSLLRQSAHEAKLRACDISRGTRHKVLGVCLSDGGIACKQRSPPMFTKTALSFAAAALTLAAAAFQPASANYAPCIENPEAAGAQWHARRSTMKARWPLFRRGA